MRPKPSSTVLTTAEEAIIVEFRSACRSRCEADFIDRQPMLEGFLSEVLDAPEPRPATWDQARVLGRANDLLLRPVNG